MDWKYNKMQKHPEPENPSSRSSGMVGWDKIKNEHFVDGLKLSNQRRKSNCLT